MVDYRQRNQWRLQIRLVISNGRGSNVVDNVQETKIIITSRGIYRSNKHWSNSHGPSFVRTIGLYRYPAMSLVDDLGIFSNELHTIVVSQICKSEHPQIIPCSCLGFRNRRSIVVAIIWYSYTNLYHS